MVALLDTLAIPKMDIVGHDWGGYASWALAIRYPERFRRHFVVSQGHPDSMLTPRSSEDVKANRSEEHTSELQSLMRVSYAVFCLKQKQMRGLFDVLIFVYAREQ